MALACQTTSVRPNLPVYGSYPGHGDVGRPASGHESDPPVTYEGYRITPRGSRHDQGKGKWYGAHTIEMPATLRDLEHMIQSRSSSGRTVLQELYSPRLEGSKREHIESFIRRRDALDPGRRHDLAYLHLDQYQRHKESKPSKWKTSAMQIIFECRIRPRNHPILPQQPVSSCGSPIRKGGWVPSSPTTAAAHGTTISPPMKTSRPQYLPQYVRQSETFPANDWLSSTSEGNRSHRDSVISTPKTINSDYDSNESEETRPGSPCSTASSDIIFSESRRRSSSSVSSGNASVTSQTAGEDSSNEDSCATLTEAEGQTEEFWSLSDSSGRKHLLPSSVCRDLLQSVGRGNPKGMAPYIGDQCSIGTQTDQESDQSDGTQSLARQPNSHEMSTKPVKSNEAAIWQNGKQSPGKTVDPGKTSESQSNDNDGAHSIGDHQEAIEMAFYEKPSWMDDLRPGLPPYYFYHHSRSSGLTTTVVSAPAIKDDDIDPLDTSPSLECGYIRKTVTSAEPAGEDAVSEFEHKATKATVTDGFHRNDSGQALKSAEINLLHDEAAPVGSKIPPLVHGLPPMRHSQPLTPLRLNTHSQPRKQSEDLSPRQRKHVTFSLPSPASTVPSTPILGTPPSSPDSASSSSSEFTQSPAPSRTLSLHKNSPTAAFKRSSCRPPLHRSSHSSTTHIARMRTHEPVPPRSSSCRDLPVREFIAHRSHEPDQSSRRQSNRYDRYQRDSIPTNRAKPAAAAPKPPTIVQQPHQATAKKVYDCKNGRCPRKGSSGFASRDDVDGHVRAVHDREGDRVVRK